MTDAMIDSVKDERVALVRRLQSRAGRYQHRRCVLEGTALIGQAVRAGIRPEFVLSDADGDAAGMFGSAPVLPTTQTVLRHALRTRRPVDAIAAVALPTENDDTVPYGDFAVVLDRIVDPGNLGTIVRTAHGLGVADIVCTDANTDLSSRKVLDAARATTLLTRIRRFTSTREALAALHDKGFQLVATSPHATVSQSAVVLGKEPVALVVGNEADGLDADVLAMADHTVRIPMAGGSAGVESLNVGVATGLSLYELRRLREVAVTPTLSDEERALLRELLSRVASE